MDDKLMTVDEVAVYLGVPKQTLYQWRHQNRGPIAFRVGRHLRYRREMVDSWLEQQAGPRRTA